MQMQMQIHIQSVIPSLRTFNSPLVGLTYNNNSIYYGTARCCRLPRYLGVYLPPFKERGRGGGRHLNYRGDGHFRTTHSVTAGTWT